jgi:methionyl-tRNA formyltransferase
VRILYLGLPLGAAVLVAAGHRPVACAIGHPDAIGIRRLRARLPRDTPLLGRPSLDDDAVRAVLASTGYDVLLSWFWPKQIPAAIGAFGVHPSLLPRWRGPDPYFHAIASGDRETGVTLHRLDETYDTGAIVDRRTLDIRPGDTAWTLARRLDRPSLALLVSCADRLAAGEMLEGVAQDEGAATDAPAPSEDALVLRFAEERADALERLVRAGSPEPGASAVLSASPGSRVAPSSDDGSDDASDDASAADPDADDDADPDVDGDADPDVDEEGSLITVQRAAVWRGTFPGGLRPGEAFVAPEGVVVRCAEGGLLLERVRVELDDRVLVGAAIAALLAPRDQLRG